MNLENREKKSFSERETLHPQAIQVT